MSVSKALRAHMATLGSKGGKATGTTKARGPEHYKRLADMRRAKAAERHVLRPHCIACGRVIWSNYHEIGAQCPECQLAHA